MLHLIDKIILLTSISDGKSLTISLLRSSTRSVGKLLKEKIINYLKNYLKNYLINY